MIRHARCHRRWVRIKLRHYPPLRHYRPRTRSHEAITLICAHAPTLGARLCSTYESALTQVPYSSRVAIVPGETELMPPRQRKTGAKKSSTSLAPTPAAERHSRLAIPPASRDADSARPVAHETHLAPPRRLLATPLPAPS